MFFRPSSYGSKKIAIGTLLQAAERMGFEGVLSKRADSFYRSGSTRDWLKIKTAAWRKANRERWELFDRRRALARL